MNNFEIYTTDYISGVMSLRKPQNKSLEILDNILNNVTPSKNLDLKEALNKVKALYPICTNFEREFMSLSFVLATGVGKTRLMGAFITYLYTKHNIKNFFVVAPGTTVYNKLKKDLGDPSNPKYVFKGVGCFNNPPKIIADDDYRNKNPDLFQSDVNIFIFNISKFDKENVKIRAINEVLGESFFEKLSKIDDLVMIMDEAHHYHAEQGEKAINEIKPILGLELTATPYKNINKSSKKIKFKNAVYEYPLSESIKDGYSKTPFTNILFQSLLKTDIREPLMH
jgi:type III restriction enzyme